MTLQEITILTQSSIKNFLTCHRKYKFRYIDKLVKKGLKEKPLYFGQVVHDGLREFEATRSCVEAITTIREIANSLIEEGFDFIDLLKAEAMLEGYSDYYKDDAYEIIVLEKEFLGNVLTPGAGVVPGFMVAGKIDGLIRQDGKYYLMEHKTTSNLEPAYLDKLWTDLQVILYSIYIEREMGITLSGVLYNVLVKTGIRQRQNEDLNEFQKRLEEVYSKPEMFYREYLEFHQADYDRVIEDIYYVALDIKRCMDNGIWYRSTQNCYQWNRPCPYYRLCKFNEMRSIKTQDYEVREPHEELEEVIKGGIQKGSSNGLATQTMSGGPF